MFEINKKDLEKRKADAMAKEMLSKMMTEMLLKSDSVPDVVKMSVRVMDKENEICKTLHDEIVEKYCTPKNEANIETLKKVLEYLEMVEVGIKQFVETTPFVAHTEEDDEEC